VSDPAAAQPAAAGTHTTEASAAGRSHRTLSILTGLLLLAIAVGAAAAALLLGKHHSPSAAAAGQRRAHLAFVAQGLREVEGEVQQEIGVTKAIWPKLAYGLPTQSGADSLADLKEGVAGALAASEAVPSPQFVAIIEELVGPAAGIAKLYRSFALLTRTGWLHVNAAIEAIESGPPAAAKAARATVGLYIASIYEGDFYASLIGERVKSTYEKLGGEPIFGAKLTQGQVASLTRTFSPGADVLTPHAWSALQTLGSS
jgi:hypothetical protein